MEINGKIYRNLEGQVAYLTTKWDDLQDQINEIKGKLTHYIIVEELPVDPEDIDTFAVYLVGPKGTAPDTYYEEWVYVKKADESWMWEKLGDTASVDLSGYLEKMEGTPSYPLAYVLLPNGNQGSIEVNANATADTIVRRTGGSQINVPYTPVATTNATSKDYVDTHCVAKQTGTTSYTQVYAKATDGSQTMLNVNGNPISDSIPYRFAYGHIKLPNEVTYPPTDDDYAISKRYADNNLLAKATGVSTYGQAYVKAADGSQTRYDISVTSNAYSIPYRDANGQIKVPETPTVDNDAASKKYVDDNATGVRYIHQLYLTYTTATDEYLTVMASLVNRSSVPITSMSYEVFRQMTLQYGDHGQSLGYNPVMVVKCPNNFHAHDFPDAVDGIYWKDLNNSTEGFATSYSMPLTVTDYVTLF